MDLAGGIAPDGQGSRPEIGLFPPTLQGNVPALASFRGADAVYAPVSIQCCVDALVRHASTRCPEKFYSEALARA